VVDVQNVCQTTYIGRQPDVQKCRVVLPAETDLRKRLHVHGNHRDDAGPRARERRAASEPGNAVLLQSLWLRSVPRGGRRRQVLPVKRQPAFGIRRRQTAAGAPTRLKRWPAVHDPRGVHSRSGGPLGSRPGRPARLRAAIPGPGATVTAGVPGVHMRWEQTHDRRWTGFGRRAYGTQPSTDRCAVASH
jgi:hypothetical protein